MIFCENGFCLLCVVVLVCGGIDMSTYLDAKQFHTVMLRDTTPPRCLMCLPRAVSVSLRIGEHQHWKMLNNSQWSRELIVHQPNFEASWETVRRLDATSGTARPDTQ
ncbi:hypothetical protein V3C99_018269 [Haemonchus contortus]